MDNKEFEYIIRKTKKLLGDEFFLLKNAILMTYIKDGQKSYADGYNAGKKFISNSKGVGK